MGQDRANSFDFVRSCAALGVLIGHQFIVSGETQPWGISNQDIAEIPLHVFFCLSGFLIYQSLDRSTDWASFVAARLTRLGPTLIVALVLASAAALIWFQNFGHLIDHAKYVYRNVFFLFRTISDFIPGVFESNPLHQINPPLWTLAYEVWCYGALFAIFLLPRYARAPMIVSTLVVLNVCWLAFDVNDFRIPFTPIFPMRVGRLGCFFFAGALVATYWHFFRENAGRYGLVALVVGTALVFLLPHTFIFSVVLSLAIIGLGASSAVSWFSRGGDPSYGIYVFAFPIQQFSVIFFQGFWQSLVFAVTLTAALGYATWHLYEKRSIQNRREVGNFIRRSFESRNVRSITKRASL